MGGEGEGGRGLDSMLQRGLPQTVLHQRGVWGGGGREEEAWIASRSEDCHSCFHGQRVSQRVSQKGYVPVGIGHTSRALWELEKKSQTTMTAAGAVKEAPNT